jgi:predicted nucleotidyltransferase
MYNHTNNSSMPMDKNLLEIIKNIVWEHLDPKIHKVFIFGSRATQTNKTFSDIDIGITGPLVAKNILSNLNLAFEESNLPYNVDIVDFNLVHDRFKKIAQEKIIPLN